MQRKSETCEILLGNVVKRNLLDRDNITGVHVERLVHGAIAALAQYFPELVILDNLSNLPHTAIPQTHRK